MPSWLPPLLTLTAFGGDPTAWLDAAYEQFARDFCGQRPPFDGRRMGLKRQPVEHGREATFWHMISSGAVEADREPDPRRVERIGWPRAIIDHWDDPAVKRWSELRPGSGRDAERIHLWCEEAMYLVVLDGRADFVLPWTAFPIEYENQARRLNAKHLASLPK